MKNLKNPLEAGFYWAGFLMPILAETVFVVLSLSFHL